MLGRDVQRLAGSYGQRGDSPVTAESAPEDADAPGPEGAVERVVGDGRAALPDDPNALYIQEVAVADEPPHEILYNHRTTLKEGARAVWAHREIVFTLAERDFRVQYKQATLGVLWAIVNPVATLLVLIIVFSRVKGYSTGSTPFPLYVFVGILSWTYFATSLGQGGNALLTNKSLLSKTQFPRECFPIEIMMVNALNTVLSWIPLALLFLFYQQLPKVTTVWVPLCIVIEILFTAGVTLGTASLIVQFRDLSQVIPIVISLGIFLTPVIWPFSKIPTQYHVTQAHLVHGQAVGGLTVNLQVIYGFFNPIGPVINTIRQTMLVGGNPSFAPLLAAAVGSVLYFVFGYVIFKKFEVSFADIA
jgi:ABC-type polysaccharide/polyol phosphate export permease